MGGTRDAEGEARLLPAAGCHRGHQSHQSSTEIHTGTPAGCGRGRAALPFSSLKRE
jgi:hypothetical protein